MKYTKGMWKLKMPVNYDDQVLIQKELIKQGCHGNVCRNAVNFLYIEHGELLTGQNLDIYQREYKNQEVRWQDIIFKVEDYEIY